MTDPSLADLAATNTKVAHLMRSHGPNVFGQTVDAYTTTIERLEQGAYVLRQIDERRKARIAAEKVSRETGAVR